MAIRDLTSDDTFNVVSSSSFRNVDDGDGNILTDTGRDLGVGLVDVGGAVAGLGDLVFSPFRDKGDSTFTQAWEDSAAGEWKRDLQAGYSDARQEAEAEYEDYMNRGDGSHLDQFGRAVFGAITNPRVALGRLAQSAPSMLAGGGVGGAAAKVALARNASLGAARLAGRIGSGVGEGLISGGQAAGEVAEYNREHGNDPTRGMAMPVLTALGVGAIGTAGGGMEAGLFNRTVREASNVKDGFAKFAMKKGLEEGAEEALQAPFETVPTNLATDKNWDEGLGRNLGESATAGFAMGAGLGSLSRGRKVEILDREDVVDGEPSDRTPRKKATWDPPRLPGQPKRTAPPDSTPKVDPSVVAEDAGISMGAKPSEQQAQPQAAGYGQYGDMTSEADAFIDANTPEEKVKAGKPAPQATAAPAPEQAVPPQAQTAQPPAGKQVDKDSFYDLWSGVHSFSDDVPDSFIKRTNGVLQNPNGEGIITSMVAASKAVGAHLSTSKMLNLAERAARGSESLEDAVVKLRKMAESEPKVEVSDLCSVAAEVLSGNPEALNFADDLKIQRQKAKLQGERNATVEKARQAQKIQEEEAGEPLRGTVDDVFADYESQKSGPDVNTHEQNAPANDPNVIDAEVVEKGNAQEDVSASVEPSANKGGVDEAAHNKPAYDATEDFELLDKEEAPSDKPVAETKTEVAEDKAEPSVEPQEKAEPPNEVNPATAKRTRKSSGKKKAEGTEKVDPNEKAWWVTDDKKRVDFGPANVTPKVNRIKPGKSTDMPPSPAEQEAAKRAMKTKMSILEGEAPKTEKAEELALHTKVSELEKTEGEKAQGPSVETTPTKEAPGGHEVLADMAFGEYQKRQAARRNEGDQHSHETALDEIIKELPGKDASMNVLVGLAARARDAGNRADAVGLLRAVAAKVKKMPDHDHRRVMDVVLDTADRMKLNEHERASVLGEVAISDKAKKLAQNADAQSMLVEELKEIQRNNPDAVKGKKGATLEDFGGDRDTNPFAALASLKTRKAEEAPATTAKVSTPETAKAEPVSVKAPEKAATVETTKAEAPTGGTEIAKVQTPAPVKAQAPVVKSSGAVAKATAEKEHGKAVAEGRAKWNPNGGKTVPANKVGKNVAKSPAKMRSASEFAKEPLWVRQTREFAVDWFNKRGGWPTQEEYRDHIWPRLAKIQNWLPADMVDMLTGNAWTNARFGDITRGSLKEPTRGTKETRRNTKQDRVDAGKKAGEAMLKEWNEQRARLLAKKDAGEELQPFEQAVLDHEKPSSADVRAYALREHQNGNTTMRLYVKDFPSESYEATTNSKQDRKGMNWDRKGMKEVSVFKHDYKGGGKAVVKAKPSDSKASMVIANGAKENSLFTDEQKSAMELKTLERLPTREAKVEAIVDALNGIEKLPSEGTGSTRTSVTMAAIMAAQRAAQAHEHSKEHWTQEQFAQVFEAISKVLNGDKNLFTNEQLETLNNLKKQILANTQLDEGKAHDAARTGMEAAKARQAKAREVPKLVADELVDDPEARAAEGAKPVKKERDEYNEPEEVVEKASESELIDDYEGDPSWYDSEGESIEGDSGSDTVGERNFGHELSGYFDDRTRIADEENKSNWDDEKVGGQSGGSINTESGRKGHFMVHGKQGLKAKLARHLKVSLKWTKDLKIGEHLEEIRKRVESNEADAQALSDWFAEKAKALEPKLAGMRYEDVANLATEAGELGRAVGVGIEDNAVYQAAVDETLRRATKSNAQTTSVQPKATKEKPSEKAPEGFRGDKNVVLSEVSRVMPKQGLFATVERLFASLKPVTEAGKKLAEKVYFSRITEGSDFLAGGRTLQLSDIVETAKGEADLQGVFSPEFAHGLWTAISNLKEMGVTDFSNIYVVDQILDDATGEHLPTSNVSDKARVCVGRCHLLEGEARNITVRTGENTWNNGKLSGGTILVQAHFKGNERAYKSGLGKKADETDVAGLATHEITHAVDAKTFGALTNALKGRLNEVAHDQLEDLAMQLEGLYMAWIEGKPLDEGIAALKERTGWSDKLITDAVAAMPHIYYPFMHEGERHYVELLASSVAGYATSEAYRNTINALAPKFGAALKEFIDNDLHSRNAPIADRASSPWIRIRREARNDSADAEGNESGSVRRDAQGKGEPVRNGAGNSNPNGHGNEGTDGVGRGSGATRRSGTDADASPSDSARGMGDETHSASSEGDADRGRRGESDVGSVHSGEGGKGRKHSEGDMGSVEGDRTGDQKRGPGSEQRGGVHSAEMDGKDSAESRAQKYFRENAKTWWGSSLLDSVLNTVDAAKAKLGLGMLFTRDLVNMASKAVPDVPAFKQWHTLMERQAAYRNDWQARVASVNERFEALPKAVKPQVNRFLETVTLEGVWPFRDPDVFETEADWEAYKAELKDSDRAALNRLEREYQALPREAQSVVYSVLHHGVESRRTRANLMKEFVEERYNSLIEKATDKTSKEKWEKEKADWIKRCDSLSNQSNAPYVPLRRFGSHVVVRQSKEYEHTKKLASEVYRRIQERTGGKPTKAQMAPFHKLQKKLNEMQGAPEHYEVQFVDGSATAKRHAKSLQKQYPDSVVESFARAEHLEGSVPSWQKLEQVITSAQQNIEIEKLASDPDTRDSTAASLAEIVNAAQRMYIEALSDDNARKSELRRMRVQGYHTNMMENFMETGRAEANLYANMSYGSKVRKVLVDMQQEVRHSSNRETAADYQNEMLRRHNQMLRGEQTSEAVNTLLRTNSVVMLMTSPAYYLQNLLQPLMMSAPYMAGNHGMGAATAAVGKTMAQAAKALRKGTSLEDIAEGMNLTKEETEALRRARDLGHIDIGMSSDFGHVTHSDAGKVKKAFAQVTDKLTEASRRVEMVNRIGTFIAAYRLENERLRGKNPEAAWQYADEVVYKTHGDYSGINAPRFFGMNSMTKIATQFRKFQLIQAGMMIGLVARSLKGATPAEKAVARRQLAWTMGVHFTMAGAKGTPFVGALLYVLGKALGEGGDDEDDWIRDMVGDKGTSDFLLNGIPKALGVDMSGKVGAGNMFNPFPFLEKSPTEGEDYWKDLVVNALGPTGSLGERALRGFGYASQGDWAKGAEAVAPTGISNLMKAIRFSTDGVTTKAGDVQIPGESYTLLDAVMQTAGLPTNKTTDRTRAMGSLIRHEEYFEGKQKQLVHDYKEAWRAKDGKAMTQLRRQFIELNKERRAQGFQPVKMSSMTKAPIQQRKREYQGQAVGSTVGVKRSNRLFVEDMMKK